MPCLVHEVTDYGPAHRTEFTTMSRCGLCLSLCVLLGLWPTASATEIISGTLTGSQEVSPTPSPALGTFLGTLDLSGPTATLSFTVTYSTLLGGDVVGANFHDAATGLVGPDVRDYDPALFGSPDGSFTGTCASSDAQPLTPALANDLISGNIYFDIQTQQFPTGEIRGQLGPATPEPSSLCLALVCVSVVAALTYFKRWREKTGRVWCGRP
jgi:hypothetical protein